MVDEVVYSAQASLRAPRQFFSAAVHDLRAVPHAGWRLFVRTNQSRFRQSLLGWVWIVVPPLVTTVTWVFLGASGVLHVGATSIPYPVYVALGTITWQLFLDSLNTPIQVLANASTSLKYAQLPHEAWLASGMLNAMLNLLVRAGLASVLIVAFDSLGGWTLLLVPFAYGATMLLGLAIGLALAVLGRLYTDVSQALGIVVGIWFFLTPVVYARQGHGLTRTITKYNPVSPLVDSARAWATSTPGARPIPLMLVTAASVALLLVAWVSYRIAKPHLVARM